MSSSSATQPPPDAQLFSELERVFGDQKAGDIGDDYIAFDDSEGEEKVEEVEEREQISKRSKEVEEPTEIKELKDSKEISSSNPSNNSNSKRKLLFFPKAPWMPKNAASSYGFLSGPRSQWLHFAERLNRELHDLSAYLAPTPAESTARALLIKKCDAVVKKLFPGMRVECFGSVDTGLYLPTSDVDLVVIPDTSNANVSESLIDPLIAPPLRKLARAIIKAGIADPRTVQVISRARVPIIKFEDRLSHLPVDISFNVASGLEGARFLKEKLIQFPALKPLLRFLKLFLHLRGLNEVFRGGLGSFSAACLMLSFLQVHPLVQLGYLQPQDNLGVLLMEFLELYGRHFNYERVGITVGIDSESTGTKNEGKSSDGQFVGYYDKNDLGFYNDSRPSLLSIQDPQCPSNDLARPSFAIGSVRQALEHAFNFLSSAAGELDVASGSKDPRDAWMRQRTDGSVLAGLIRLPEGFLEQRRLIERVFSR